MSGPSIFFEDVNERQGGFLRRTFLLGGATAIGLTALSARLAYLQVLETGRYRSMSAENQFNLRLMPPPRGRIRTSHRDRSRWSSSPEARKVRVVSGFLRIRSVTSVAIPSIPSLPTSAARRS